MRNSEVPIQETSIFRLWLQLFLFCIPLALGWAVFEWGLAKVPNSHSVKRARLEAFAPELDTLIVGSSSAYYGISPAQLSGSAFNVANVSQTLYYDDHLVTQLLPRLTRLQRVIVSVSYISLFFQLHDSEQLWRQYYYQHDWGIPPPRLRDRADARMWSRVALYGPRLALNLASNGFKTSLAQDVDERGWYQVPGQPRQPDLGPAAAQKRLAYHHSIMHAENMPANLDSLDHLLSFLRQRSIDVTLVALPVWTTYADGMKAAYWDRTEETFEQLAQKYGARYISHLREPRLTSEDFADVDHLNARGAVHFTELLNSELGKPKAGPPRPKAGLANP